jgi:CheY-like chemotaxis protein
MRNALYVMRMAGIADPLVAKSTEILERQVSHVVRLVDDLMDVARLERGKVSLKKACVNLNRVVASAVETCSPAARESGHEIGVRLNDGALPVEADTVRVEQIVCNLLNNAAKFSPRSTEIRVETSVDGAFAVVAVEDEGVGFEQQVAASLFDPFVQMNPTLERSAGGLGMGLTIVRRLAELHGGSVHASSEGPGKGSRFVVRLPLAARNVEERPGFRHTARSSGGRRVVVIEDNPDIRETLQMLMNIWGHDVTMAGDGRSGIDLVLRQRPDVALIDVGLPGMNGYEVARAIRRAMPNDTIRLVAVTGYGQSADREEAMHAGFDAHVLKPIEPETLERLLAEGRTPAR